MLRTVLLVLVVAKISEGGDLRYPNEKYFSNVRQLTFGGANDEGYFSFDDTKLTLQATIPGSTNCDQIYQFDLTKDPKEQVPRRMSTGIGATTCSYFMRDNEHFLYADTFHHTHIVQVNITAKNPQDAFDTCPQKKCQQKLIDDPKLRALCNTSYTWDVYPEYDIFLADKYANIVSRLTNTWGYDAEGVVSPDGKLIAFTSMRSGDLDLWIMNSDGSNPRQITNSTGYEGGSFFSPDGKRLIFRASTPKTPSEIQKYKDLLSYNLVAPTEMELFKIDIDGSNLEQITHLGGANWAPFYLHDNKRVIFSSDFNNTADFGAFDLYLINDDGTGLDRVTWDVNQFDSFPMMSYSGKQLVWGSSRNASKRYELNLFLADWVEPSEADSTSPLSSSTPLSETTTKECSFLLSFTSFFLLFLACL